MNKQYIPAVVSIDVTDYAYPCFHQGDRWNGWAMPYFRFEHAQQVALEFKGRYDKENDNFVFDDNGEEDVFTPFVVSIDGEDVKLYGIGAGYWCWDLVDDMKLFEGYWGNDFYNEGTYLTLESFYSEDRCYDKEDVEKIHSLPVGAEWTCPDYGTGHTVTRVK